MKRFGWLLLGLPLAIAFETPAPGAEAPKAFGTGPTYTELAKLPVMHEGRKKPFDTLAREEVKQIFSRETIKLLGPGDEVTATWGPVAALFNWSVRPEFWDDQPIILVEYIPLKRLLLAESIEARLSAIANESKTTAGDRTAAKALSARKDLSAEDLRSFAHQATLSEENKKAVEVLADELGEAHKWLTPRQLESARVKVDGQTQDFNTWFRELADRKGKIEANAAYDGPKLTDVEKRAIEVGTRLVHYQAIRDRTISSVEPMLVMPRPNNPTYLAYCGAAFEKARERQGVEGLSPLELDSANVLLTYYKDIPREDWKEPGKDAEFDANFTAWLKANSVWIPLRVFLDTKAEDLAKAGFPAKEAEAFLTSFQAMEKAEEASPGAAPKAAATTLLAATRALGEKVNGGHYPTAKEMDLEAYFNETNPFFKAPYGYGLAMALLAVSLGFTSNRERGPKQARPPFWQLGSIVYWAGIIGLLIGIALEVLGFTMRVQISGWAPVTNMYETVIWVSLVAAVLGVIFEILFQKTFAALAGAGVALLGTLLAANVPLLDPGIHSLQPVLRSNYWLTIHVLTEVSSYAAFALAMGLGMIATFYYLTATYRRSPAFLEVGAPLIPGVPLLLLGAFGLSASYGGFGINLPLDRANLLFNVSAVLAGLGGSMSIIGGGGVFGELVARATFRDQAALEHAITTQAGEAALTVPAATSVQTVTVEERGSVATATKPTVAEIRARAAASRPQLDARGLAMQETAAKIKPLSNFIYRTMQVGVLLIAAGTILGGVWADYSWGRFWGWDPKEVWALITLLVYLIPLHGRFAGWVNTFSLVISSVVCFLSVIMAWYGVNFVLGVGLHSYGFVEGGSQGVVLAVVLGVLSVTGAAAWRRGLASRVPTPTA